MIEAFWIPLLPPYLIGLVLSFAVEALLTPRPVAPWKRPMAAVGVHVGVWTLAFALELMLFRRPYFAVANVLAIELLIVLVSNAKFKALKEPFVYPDFEYFLDAVKHPRLYLPFFGVWRAVAAGGGYGAALWAGLVLEDSITAGAGMWLMSFAELSQEHMFDATAPVVPFFANTCSLMIVGLGFTILVGQRYHVTFNATQDLTDIGIFGALWAYRRCERQPTGNLRANAPFSKVKPSKSLPDPLPDLIVVQSESFFDARRTYPHLLRPDVLESFDLLKSEAVACGQLTVPAWGANTVRTEFAFLTGMNPGMLGIHQYNPYRKFAAQAVPTIASHLKSLGYRTVCVHPYHRGFYRRDTVLPRLGFDEFIGIEGFEDFDLAGPYVGDRALGDYVTDKLRQTSGQPLYVHVITMENHGPLHWETVDANDVDDVLTVAMPEGCQDLVAYARHLRNADAMFSLLRETLINRSTPSVLCLFGDHLPIMSDVYRSLGEPDGTTDYVIWHSDRRGQRRAMDRGVASLAEQFLQAAEVIA